jgi:hypothetical protein
MQGHGQRGVMSSVSAAESKEEQNEYFKWDFFFCTHQILS